MISPLRRGIALVPVPNQNQFLHNGIYVHVGTEVLCRILRKVTPRTRDGFFGLFALYLLKGCAPAADTFQVVLQNEDVRHWTITLLFNVRFWWAEIGRSCAGRGPLRHPLKVKHMKGGGARCRPECCLFRVDRPCTSTGNAICVAACGDSPIGTQNERRNLQETKSVGRVSVTIGLVSV